jgi:hypothetical protein
MGLGPCSHFQPLAQSPRLNSHRGSSDSPRQKIRIRSRPIDAKILIPIPPSSYKQHICILERARFPPNWSGPVSDKLSILGISGLKSSSPNYRIQIWGTCRESDMNHRLGNHASPSIPIKSHFANTFWYWRRNIPFHRVPKQRMQQKSHQDHDSQPACDQNLGEPRHSNLHMSSLQFHLINTGL